jgi:hypothetical protein
LNNNKIKNVTKLQERLKIFGIEERRPKKAIYILTLISCFYPKISRELVKMNQYNGSANTKDGKFIIQSRLVFI